MAQKLSASALAVVTCADWGEVSSRSFLYRPASRISCQRGVRSSLNDPYIGLLSLGWALAGAGGMRRQDQSRTTLPHTPERAASNASCHFSAGKRWVMTELTAARSRSLVWSIELIAYQVSYISRP